MMNNKKSNRAMKIKYLIAVPTLLVSAMVLFLNFQMNGQTSATPDVMPEYKSGENAFYKTFQKYVNSGEYGSFLEGYPIVDHDV